MSKSASSDAEADRDDAAEESHRTDDGARLARRLGEAAGERRADRSCVVMVAITARAAGCRWWWWWCQVPRGALEWMG
ncbi:hypothetical protein L9G15_24785, partial [Shewanella sp. A3A]|nr:hypothetical protein [Shewanella ferrihydritica]